MALVTLIDEERQWFKSSYGMPGTETSREVSFCAHTILHDEVLVINDTTLDQRFQDNLYVTGQPHIRFYAGAPLQTGDGMNLGALCAVDVVPRQITAEEQRILSDLAAMVSDEIELRHAIRERKRLEELQDNLTSMIIHDLRSPLTTTITSLSLLKMNAARSMDPRHLELVETASYGAATLQTMITSLLDVQRLESGAMPLDIRSHDLREIITSSTGYFKTVLWDRALGYDLPNDPINTLCDRDTIQRVLMNLLSNAVKFTPDTGTIRISLFPADAYVMVCVTDTGPGIPGEYHDHIFEKFGQVASHTHKHSTGLGLTFCKLAIEAHGGAIGVQSTVGEGTSIWFTLPAAD
jgi:signal transduction histidine kinase